MAHLLEITGHSEEPINRFASLGLFDTREAGEIPSEIVIQEEHITPYCLDHESGCLIFTELPPELDLTGVPFAYQAQRRHAKRLISVPYGELQSLSEQVPLPKHVVFIYNTSRCGSTLMHRVLNKMEWVGCFSEVDTFTNIWEMTETHQDSEPLADLLYHSLRLFAYPYADQIVGFKFKHLSILNANLIHRAFPTATNLFMYRNAIDWSSSWERIFVDQGGPPEQLDRKVFVNLRWLVSERTRTFFDRVLDADQVTVRRSLGFSLMWIDSIDGYLQAHEQGIPMVALRYEDLSDQRIPTLELVLDAIGIPLTKLEQALLGFEQHSQLDAPFDGGNKMEIGEEHIQAIVNLLEKHPRKLAPYMVLPDTLRPMPKWCRTAGCTLTGIFAG
jgi:hypothetical protein